MKITMELEPEQLQIIVRSLEEYFRLRMGQFDHVAMEFAMDTYPEREDFATENDFIEAHNSWCDKRDYLQSVLRSAVEINYGTMHSELSDDCRNASDLWSSIRHAHYIATYGECDSWDVRSAPPMNLGTMYLPKIEIEVSE